LQVVGSNAGEEIEVFEKLFLIHTLSFSFHRPDAVGDSTDGDSLRDDIGKNPLVRYL
jgi:hypothetical protein